MSNSPKPKKKPPKNAGSKKARSSSGVAARRVAIQALVRIERDQAYANLVLGPLLERSGLEERDRAFVSELVYGTTRMKRACDFLVDRFVLSEVEPQVRAALRIGAYQLHFLEMPHHAALDATVGAVKGPGRGLVNAVLRRVATSPVEWPSDGVRLSYPDWMVKLLRADMGEDLANRSLEAMNERAVSHARSDGYVQDLASQEVVRLCGVEQGDRVLDVCAAPGGKATGLALEGADVVACDLRPSRAALMASNVERLDADVAVVVADGIVPPFAPASFDRVLVDAPCTGLGSLRRRADARWRLDPLAPSRLADLQLELLSSARTLVKPGGTLIYSVCTLSAAETTGVVDRLLAADSGLTPIAPPPDPWITDGAVGFLAPDTSDGMALARFIVA